MFHEFTLNHFDHYRLELDAHSCVWRLWVIAPDGSVGDEPRRTGRWNPRDRSITFDEVTSADVSERAFARALQARITSFLPQPLTHHEIN